MSQVNPDHSKTEPQGPRQCHQLSVVLHHPNTAPSFQFQKVIYLDVAEASF